MTSRSGRLNSAIVCPPLIRPSSMHYRDNNMYGSDKSEQSISPSVRPRNRHLTFVRISGYIRYPTCRNPRGILRAIHQTMFDVQRCTGGAPNPRHLDFRFHTPNIQSLRTATQTLRAFNELHQPYAGKKPSVAPIGSLFNGEYSEYITNGSLAPS